MRIDLNKKWIIKSDKIGELKACSPCTVLSVLLENKIIEDPYFRDNEPKAREYLYEDYSFETSFDLDANQLKNKNYLHLDGISTIGTVFVNKIEISKVFDFHTPKKYLLDNSILKEHNTLVILFKSSYKYIKEYPNPKNLFQTYAVTDKDSPVIRQPNYMFGWDWAPSLADMGITRDIYILSTKVGYIDYFERRYDFQENQVDVTITPHAVLNTESNIKVELNGHGFNQVITTKNNQPATFTIKDPKLWYPVGFGSQPLYELTISLEKDDFEKKTYLLGIREIKIDDSKDKYGRNFALYLNGKKIFLKGSNYVPEDNILSLIKKERTEKLLNLAVRFNHNVIRIWGGGYYPEDYFYEYCDKIGLLVSQDLMFACASYDIHDESFKNLVLEETTNNLRRFGYHSCLFMIAGNNEIEDGVRGHGYQQTVNAELMFNKLFNDIVSKETDLYYLPSSPTSGAPYYSSPNDPSFLDTHYWWVWGDGRPFEDYLSIKPRLLSEFGCESLSTYETICKYTDKSDRTIDSHIMNIHEKSRSNSNEKIVYYLSQQFNRSEDLKKMSYLSMMTQAEGIRLCVEHLRQNKEICNGALYWQLNDSWPGSTCSSIDYYFGIKALHYYSKRFYAPDLVSFNYEEKDTINVSNDTDEDKKYYIILSEFDINGNVLNSQKIECQVNKYSDSNYKFERKTISFGLMAQLYNDSDELLSENYLLDKKDKDIQYPKAKIAIKKFSEKEIEISSNTFVKGLYLLGSNDVVFSDNFFNLLPNTKKIVRINKNINIDDLKIMSLNNL